MDRLGYDFGEHSGCPDIEYVGQWTIWCARHAEQAFQYVLALGCPGGAYTLVWLPQLPDLMAYLARYGGIGQAQVLQGYLEEMNITLRRAFMAWHGHDAITFCRDCDPKAYDAWQQQRAKRAAQQRIATR